MSEYFGDEGYCIFNSIEPEDVKQGNIDNVHLLAVLSGLAERDMSGDSKMNSGMTIRNLFITQEVNSAGCYALKFCIDGEERIVVVDDYMPVKVNKHGKKCFAFAKTT